MESGVISEMNQKQVMEEAEEKLAVQKKGKERKGGKKKKIYEKDGVRKYSAQV